MKKDSIHSFQVDHGGDIYRNDVKYDFSVNVNPLGMPEEIRKKLAETPEIWERYPDPQCAALRKRISEYHGVRPEQILCGNGATELLQLLIRRFPRGKVLLPIPSFQEYERLLLQNGYSGQDICFYELKKEKDFLLDEAFLHAITEDIRLLILGNPNNPAGGIVEPDLLRAILDRCCRQGIRVILDQCFLEMTEGAGDLPQKVSCSRLIQDYPQLYVVDAVTKLYAMAGLRLGYCFHGNGAELGRLHRMLPCWNVSGGAQLAGEMAFSQADYRRRTMELLKEEHIFLERGLIAYGARVVRGSAPFLLFYREGPVYDALLNAGILIRDCRHWRGLGPGYYRIGVKTHAENEILLKTMERL